MQKRIPNISFFPDHFFLELTIPHAFSRTFLHIQQMKFICHDYAAAAEISYVPSTACSSHPIFFSNSGHMSLVPRSRHLWILGTLWAPLGGQKGFSCGHSREPSFQPIFFIFSSHQIWVGPKSSWQSIFGTLWFWLWPPGGQISLFPMKTVNHRSYNWSFSNSHHTFTRPRPTCQEIFSTLQFQFWPQGAKSFFLYVPYNS